MPAGVLLAAVVAFAVSPSSNLILYGAIAVGGIFAWRQKRGDFYKSVADEKRAQVDKLQDENVKLRQATDITPLLDQMRQVTDALTKHTEMTERVFDKVADMNGALRAHAEAMKALADHLILDEAARGLLAAAVDDKTRQPSRRSQA